MHYGYGPEAMMGIGGHFGFGGLLFVGLWVLVLVGVFMLVRRSMRGHWKHHGYHHVGPHGGSAVTSPLGLLQERLVKEEISVETYRLLKAELEGGLPEAKK